MPIRSCLAVALFSLAACASQSAEDSRLDAQCRALQAACNVKCEAEFEENRNAWDYQSCIRSCRPSERSQCRGTDTGY